MHQLSSQNANVQKAAPTRKAELRRTEGPETLSGDSIPFLLRDIPEPLKQLWIEGKLPAGATGPADDTKYLCVIGPRKHSAYGKEACQKLISGLKGHNVCIVSGLGIGLDSIAHEAALEAGLRTIAFPGSGLNRSVLYPASRHRLADRIVKAGGALLSEFDLDQQADAWTFPQRNRLMAGMSHATLLIEAAADSGALITPAYAHEYGRKVLCLPGSIFSPLSYGPNKFIDMGSSIVRSSEDILDALGIDRSLSESTSVEAFGEKQPASTDSKARP